MSRSRHVINEKFAARYLHACAILGAIIAIYREEIVNSITQPQLILNLLGSFRATLGEKTVQGFVSGKVQALLAYLAMAERPCPRSRLAALLWGEMPEADALANLRKALSNLRQLVGPYLLINRCEAGLNPESNYWVDALAFQQAALRWLPRAETTPGGLDDAAMEELQHCAAGYNGEFLDAFRARTSVNFEDWMLLERQRLHNLAGQVFFQLGAQHAARRRYVEALTASSRLLSLAPWNEDAHRQRMSLLACQGHRAAALRQYEIFRQALQDKLGAQPGAEIQALYQRLAQGDGTLPEMIGAPSTRPVHRLPFVGREDEHAWLLQRWSASQRWQGGLTLVAGEAGIGKTRLMEQVLEQVALQGGVVMSGRCYELNRALPFQAIHDALRNYLADLPEEARPQLSDDLLMDVERLLAAAREAWPNGITLFLDDLQWADADMLDFLHYLVCRLSNGPCWFVGTYRPTEISPDHPLTRLMNSLENDSLLFSLSLQPLSEQEVARLVDLIAAPGSVFLALPAAELAEALFSESQGNPSLLTEMVPWLQECDDPRLASSTLQALHLPSLLSERAQLLIRRRIERLDETSQYLLSLAAAFDQPFDSEMLQAAGDCSREVVERAVKGWLDCRLVRSQGGRMDFIHDTTRSYLFNAVPAPLRRLLHARLGAALEALYPYSNRPFEPLAHHFDLACNWRKALLYLKLAGDEAAQAGAGEQAQRHYLRGLEIVRQHLAAGSASVEQELNFLLTLEELNELQGRRAGQQASTDLEDPDTIGAPSDSYNVR